MSNLSIETENDVAAYREALVAYEAALAVVSSRVSSARCPTKAELEQEERARAALVTIRMRLGRDGRGESWKLSRSRGPG